MLQRPFYTRARAAVVPPGSVSMRATADEFIDSVERGSSDVAVIDPVLATRDRGVAGALARAHLGTVLYISLTPEYARASIELIRELGAGEIVTYGYNDDPTTFAGILRRQSRNSRGLLLVTALSRRVESLSPVVSSCISLASERVDRVDSVDQLARTCGTTRYVLARQFRSAGIASPSVVVAALTLLRNYDLLADANLTLLDVARAVGLSSERALRRQCVSVSGLSIAAIRKPLPIEHFVECVVNVLTTQQKDED